VKADVICLREQDCPPTLSSVGPLVRRNDRMARREGVVVAEFPTTRGGNPRGFDWHTGKFTLILRWVPRDVHSGVVRITTDLLRLRSP
jgi:hypothetical protein